MHTSKYIHEKKVIKKKKVNTNLLSEQLRELRGHGAHAEPIDDLLLGSAEVAGEDNLGPLVGQEVDGRTGGAEARGVGYRGRRVLRQRRV